MSPWSFCQQSSFLIVYSLCVWARVQLPPTGVGILLHLPVISTMMSVLHLTYWWLLIFIYFLIRFGAFPLKIWFLNVFRGNRLSLLGFVISIKAVVTIVQTWEAHAKKVRVILKSALNFEQVIVLSFQIFKWCNVVQIQSNRIGCTRWSIAPICGSLSWLILKLVS